MPDTTRGGSGLGGRPEVRRALLQRVLDRLNLRFPTLFVILLSITIADVLVPDFIPFVDEIVLALVTALVALLKEPRRPAGGNAAPHPPPPPPPPPPRLDAA